MITPEAILSAARALLKGVVPDNALGIDVMYAVRGFRAGMVDRRDLLEAVARGYRAAGSSGLRFDRNGNLRKV